MDKVGFLTVYQRPVAALLVPQPPSVLVPEDDGVFARTERISQNNIAIQAATDQRGAFWNEFVVGADSGAGRLDEIAKHGDSTLDYSDTPKYDTGRIRHFQDSTTGPSGYDNGTTLSLGRHRLSLLLSGEGWPELAQILLFSAF